MLSADYYRKQADLCVRLARTAASIADAARFNALAIDLLLKAADAEARQAESPIRSGTARGGRDAA